MNNFKAGLRDSYGDSALNFSIWAARSIAAWLQQPVAEHGEVTRAHGGGELAHALVKDLLVPGRHLDARPVETIDDNNHIT